jgi:hypothetical protein
MGFSALMSRSTRQKGGLGATPGSLCLYFTFLYFYFYKQRHKCLYFYNFNKSNNINILITTYQYMYIKLTVHIIFVFLSVKCKFCSGLRKAKGFWALLMLISARFLFDSVIYCNFCSFWVSLIYRCWIVVFSRLVDYFDFIFAHFWFNEVLSFSLKNLFCGKSILN